jgi:hypothetical protein
MGFWLAFPKLFVPGSILHPLAHAALCCVVQFHRLETAFSTPPVLCLARLI